MKIVFTGKPQKVVSDVGGCACGCRDKVAVASSSALTESKRY